MKLVRSLLTLIILGACLLSSSFSALAQKGSENTVRGNDLPFSIKLPGSFKVEYEKTIKDNLYLEFTFENADESSYYLEGSAIVMRFASTLTTEQHLKAAESFIDGFRKAFKGREVTPKNQKTLSFNGYTFNLKVIQEPAPSQADCETNHYFIFNHQNSKIVMFRFSTAAEEEDEAILAMNSIMKSFKINK